MSERKASACGKIILSGEYAVVFGKRGIAIPSKESMTVTWEEDASLPEPKIIWDGVRKEWTDYARQILEYLKPYTGDLRGGLSIQSNLPLGKGMGSSTSLVIAISRCMLGPECEKAAREVEDQINAGHSGIDFAVIWAHAPVLFSQNTEPMMIDLPKDILKDAELIDTGQPRETTKELVAWIKTRVENPLPWVEENPPPDTVTKRLHLKQSKEIKKGAGFLPAASKTHSIAEAIDTIGNCTERLLQGESLHTVMRDHHRAQVALGVVPDATQKIIAEIEKKGGSAKVIGAGGRTGGGGMVLVLPQKR